jgi:hypothetical protein
MRDLLILAVGALFGLGATVSGAVGPTYLTLPPWAQHWLFWGGFALMFLMGVDALFLFVWKPTSLTAACANVAIFFICATAISHSMPKPQSESDPIEGSIFVSCRIDFLPTTIPPEGEVNVVVFSPEELSKGGQRLVLGKQTGSIGSTIEWIPKSRFLNSYRCEITNDTKGPLLNAIIPFHVTFATLGTNEKDTKTYYLQLVRLDQGAPNRLVVYFRNISSKLAFIVVGDHGQASTTDESRMRPIRVSKPIDILDQIIGIPPLSPPPQEPAKDGR